MDSATNVKAMLYGNFINVPDYQRAYSWETPSSDFNGKTHTDVFLEDLENHISSKVETPYYFGHFLFEETDSGHFDVIDGQQRLTTIIIFLSVLFSKLNSIRSLTDEEKDWYEKMIRGGGEYAFSTVNYDDQFFWDYVINQNCGNIIKLETNSAKRIKKAFDYFTRILSKKDNVYLEKVLDTIICASCTIHLVKSDSESIQMFIFQNNRGKQPTNLEIIKAQFMYCLHLHAGNEVNILIEEVKNRFEKIYKSIAAIEHRIDEDSILLYTLRVFFNSLWENNAVEKIDKHLNLKQSDENKQPNKEEIIQFILNFSRCLEDCFKALTLFYVDDERDYFEVHSLITLGILGDIMPFILKAYLFPVEKDDFRRFCAAAESLIIRHRLIGTRAIITSRLNDFFQSFTKDNPNINPTIDRIVELKTVKIKENEWLSYWSNERLEDSICGYIEHSTAKYLLWKYENYLESQEQQKGYEPRRYETIERPELEHIAPQTKPGEEASGYGDYDESFVNEYLDCLGNYLLVSKKHNCSIGNKPFSEKRDSYSHLYQQREIQAMAPGRCKWNKTRIDERLDKIVKFIKENL
ncbi:MAG: DUF262 domain-containing HNH endonuclease family protein [Deltaproteobacteria bacterium]|jgi:hypothetical protein|nr:DUF262 domain-containing HNH endonuclease family protein [Deltaproteobacteria bacterium]